MNKTRKTKKILRRIFNFLGKCLGILILILIGILTLPAALLGIFMYWVCYDDNEIDNTSAELAGTLTYFVSLLICLIIVTNVTGG